MDTTANTRHLTNVSEREAEAMRALDHETLAGLVTLIRCLAKDDDVAEHATIIVASLYSGATNGIHAARAAVRIAQRAVNASRALRAEDMYGDLTEEVVTDWRDAGVRTSLTRYAPDPASGPLTSITYGDLVATLCAMLPATCQRTCAATREQCAAHSPRGTLTLAAETYAAHARECTTCAETDSHRVTLAGVIQHAEGIDATHAEYHSLRRAVLASLKRVPGFTALCEGIGDPSPLARAHEAQGSVSHGDTRKESTRDQVAPVRTVRTREGVRAMTEAEVTALRTHQARAARYAGEEYRGGTHGPSAHDRSETTGMVRSFAVAPSPRKRARTGSTGPTVPVW